jgi:kynurenine formamidase
MVGDAKLIDVSEMRNFNEPVNRQLLTRAAEEQNVSIVSGDILLVRVWPGKWGDEGFFEAKQFSKDAAEFFVEKDIRLMGTDMPTCDVLTDFQRPVHVSLCKAGIVIVEGLINLDQLVGKTFTFIALPLRMKDASGSPVRAIAMIDDEMEKI